MSGRWYQDENGDDIFDDGEGRSACEIIAGWRQHLAEYHNLPGALTEDVTLVHLTTVHIADHQATMMESLGPDRVRPESIRTVCEVHAHAELGWTQ